MAELEKLRSGVRERLAAPIDAADREKAEGVFREAKLAYAEAMMADNLPEVRRQAGILLWHTENAIALLNKTYYHFGVRRRYEELSSMSKRPEALCAMIEDIVSAHEIMTLKACLTRMMRETAPCFEKALPKYTPSEQPPAAEALRGTYEEIYSNWRGKMHLASETGDRHLAFMSLLSLEGLLSGITGRTQMKPFSVMAAYDPLDLDKTKRGFDAFLRNYEKEYRRAGLEPALYRDAEAFVSAYLDRPGAGKEP